MHQHAELKEDMIHLIATQRLLRGNILKNGILHQDWIKIQMKYQHYFHQLKSNYIQYTCLIQECLSHIIDRWDNHNQENMRINHKKYKYLPLEHNLNNFIKDMIGFQPGTKPSGIIIQ